MATVVRILYEQALDRQGQAIRTLITIVNRALKEKKIAPESTLRKVLEV